MLRIKANIRLQDGQRPTRAAGTALGQQRAFRMSSGRREDREPRNDLGQRAHLYVILTTGAIATGGTDLGQVRVREPGSGFRKSRSAPSPPTLIPHATHSLNRAPPQRVRHPVMRSQAVLRNIAPPFTPWQLLAALRME